MNELADLIDKLNHPDTRKKRLALSRDARMARYADQGWRESVENDLRFVVAKCRRKFSRVFTGMGVSVEFSCVTHSVHYQTGAVAMYMKATVSTKTMSITKHITPKSFDDVAVEARLIRLAIRTCLGQATP